MQLLEMCVYACTFRFLHMLFFLAGFLGFMKKNLQTHIWGYKNISTVLDTRIFWEAAEKWI